MKFHRTFILGYNAVMTTTHSQVIDAINVRISTRHFDSDPIEEGLLRQLMQNIDAMSLISGVRFTFVENHPELFEVNGSMHGFHGAAHVIVLSGPADDAERIEQAGFYGERLVLTSVLQGLASCWVDDNIDLEKTAHVAHIPHNEIIYACIAIGYFADQKALLEKSYEERAKYQQSHRPSLSVEKLGHIESSSPQWYRNAVSAVAKAPSPSNSQPYRFRLSDDERTVSVSAAPTEDSVRLDFARAALVLGIAKLHFQIGASSDPDNAIAGQWAWGRDGNFTIR